MGQVELPERLASDVHLVAAPRVRHEEIQSSLLLPYAVEEVAYLIGVMPSSSRGPPDTCCQVGRCLHVLPKIQIPCHDGPDLDTLAGERGRQMAGDPPTTRGSTMKTRLFLTAVSAAVVGALAGAGVATTAAIASTPTTRTGPAVTTAGTDIDFAGTVALSNCSGSLVRYTSSQPSD